VRKALVVLAPLLLGACSLLLGEGFSTPDSASADGGTEAGSSGETSVTADAAADASSSLDSGSDAGNMCNLQGSFCDDFNRAPAMLKGEWDTVHLIGDAGLSLVPAAAGVGSRLEATILLGGGTNATMEKNFPMPQTPSKFHLEFKVEWGGPPTGGISYIAGIIMPYDLSQSPSLVYVYIEADGTVWFVQQHTDAAGMYDREPFTMAAGVPHQVVIDVTFNGPLKAAVDGTTLVDRTAASYLVRSPMELAVGTSAIGDTSTGFTERVDDVIFHVE